METKYETIPFCFGEPFALPPQLNCLSVAPAVRKIFRGSRNSNWSSLRMKMIQAMTFPNSCGITGGGECAGAWSVAGELCMHSSREVGVFEVLHGCCRQEQCACWFLVVGLAP